jgi:DNA-binding transcriptional regulator YiaG
MAKSEAERILELRDWIASGHARALRVNAGVSQQVAARTIGVDVVTLLRWEKGRTAPRGHNAREYHRLLTNLARRQAAAS